MALKTVQEVNKTYRPTLSAFSRALTREAHVLTQQPDLLWQQLYNRLQWEDDLVKRTLAPELSWRSRPGARPWVHRYSRLRESETLISTIVTGHMSGVTSCAISPDNSWVVSTTVFDFDRKYIKIWDAASGTERVILTGHNEGVESCAVSPDGTWLVSASADKTLKTWDTATGTERATLSGHQGTVLNCAVSPDGAHIVSASKDKTLIIWDSVTGKKQAALNGHTDSVQCCTVSPDGAWIVSASLDGTLKIWDIATGRLKATLTGHTGGVSGCAVSPDGTWIVSAGWDGTLRIWDTATGRCRGSFTDTAGLTHCAVSPDGKWIFSTSRALNYFAVWDAATGQKKAHSIGHTDYVSACIVSRDGTRIISASHDGTLKTWNAALIGKPLLPDHTGAVTACAVSADGARIVSASEDHTLKIWDAATGNYRTTFSGHREGVLGCALSPDGTFVVSCSVDAALKIWDIATGIERATLIGHGSTINACAVSPNGGWIVSAAGGPSGGDNTLKIWDTATGKVKATLSGHTGHVEAVAVSPDGAWIVSASGGPSGGDNTLRIWDSVTGKKRFTLTGHAKGVNACVVSPDGTRIVSASDDDTLKIWNAATGKELATLTSHTNGVRCCAVSPDGTWIVSGGGFDGDKNLVIWDSVTGLERATLSGHTRPVNACLVSPDGSWIVSASLDSTLRVWDAATGTERAKLVLSGTAEALAIHPFVPVVVCGDSGGGVHLVHLIGIEFGPLVVTAALSDDQLTVVCPTCQHRFQIDRKRLGGEITCSQISCHAPLRVNSFFVAPPVPVIQLQASAIPRPAANDDEAREQIAEALRHPALWLGVIRLIFAILGVVTIAFAPGGLFGAFLVEIGVVIITIAQFKSTMENFLPMVGVSTGGILLLLGGLMSTWLLSPEGWLYVGIWLALQCFTFWYKNRPAAATSGTAMRWVVHIYLVLAIAAVAGCVLCFRLIF